MVLSPAVRPDFNSLFNSLLASREDSTVKKYLKEISKFLLWCRTRKISLQLPFSSSVVALYLFGLDQQLKSPAAIVLVHAALKWFHSFVSDDGPNPLDNACCKNLIECAKRTCGNLVNKKKPVDPTIIRSIIDRHGIEEASLKDLRIAAISSLGFAGFLRFNELSNIQAKHLTFCDGFVKTFVPRSRTDVYREGNYDYIAKLEAKYCPVAILRSYIEAANLDLSSHLPLFRPVTKTRSGYSLRNAKLSYTRCREIFKTTLKDLDCDSRNMAYIVCVLGVLRLSSVIMLPKLFLRDC